MRSNRAIWTAMVLVSWCLQARGADKYTDENRPYEFGFNIDGEQHRHEKKDENGLIMGEFGFITADGVYHVTVYATDENGNFKILSMKNIRVKPYPTSSDRASNSRAIELPLINSVQPVPPLSPAAVPLATLPKPSPIRSCSSCSIPTTTTQAPKQLTDLAVVSRDDQSFPPYPNQPTNSRGRQLIPEQNQAAAPVQPSTIYVPPKYNTVPIQPPQTEQLGQEYASNLSQPGQQPQQQPGQFDQQPGQFSQQPDQFSQQPGQFEQQQNQFGQQPGQFSQQPGQFGQQPSQFGQQPGQFGQQPNLFGQQPIDQQPNDPLSSQHGFSKDSQDINIDSRFKEQGQPSDQSEPSPTKPQLISAQMRIVESNTDINHRNPGEQEGLPNGLNKDDMLQLLYTFNYTVGFHGHHEEGYTNGVKKGYYYVTGRDGLRTRIDYIADSEGFHPKISSEVLELLSEDVPKPETEKDEKYGLKGYEFKWIYYPLNSRR